MSKPTPTHKPIVFACAGCSFAGRLAYDLAQEIDHRGIAEMSCLAGLGADHPSFRRKLRDRSAWVIDGCPIECSKGVFDRNRDRIDLHIRLHEMGFQKTSPPAEGVDLDELVASVTERAFPSE